MDKMAGTIVSKLGAFAKKLGQGLARIKLYQEVDRAKV